MRGSISAPRCAYAYNLLDNSDFRNPVNQRGRTGYEGNGYTIDRWILASEQGTAAMSIGDEGIVLDNRSSTNCVFVQRFPKGRLKGAAYTLVYCDSNGYIRFNYSPLNTSLSDCDYIEIRITSWIRIIWASLYEGTYTAETLPPYHPKGYAAELTECQRYYADLGEYFFTAKNQWSANYGTIAFPVQMHKTPTITLYNPDTGVAGTIGALDASVGAYVDFTGFYIFQVDNKTFTISSHGNLDYQNGMYRFRAVANAEL